MNSYNHNSSNTYRHKDDTSDPKNDVENSTFFKYLKLMCYNLEARNIYVMLPQQDNILEDATIVSDYDVRVNKKSKNYIIKFVNGDKTLRYFKNIYVDDDYNIIVFFVENFELFNTVFAVFRYCNFIYVNANKYEEKNYKYIAFEKILRKENNLACDKKILRFGYEKSYLPDVYSSVITSIKNPEIYLNYEACPESIIYNEIIKEPKTIQELFFLNIKDIENRVKSLLFVGVLIFKGDKLHINTL